MTKVKMRLREVCSLLKGGWVRDTIYERNVKALFRINGNPDRKRGKKILIQMMNMSTVLLRC